jgi:hypothetical protein
MPNDKIVCTVFPELLMASISFAFRNEDEGKSLSFGCDGRFSILNHCIPFLRTLLRKRLKMLWVEIGGTIFEIDNRCSRRERTNVENVEALRSGIKTGYTMWIWGCADFCLQDFAMSIFSRKSRFATKIGTNWQIHLARNQKWFATLVRAIDQSRIWYGAIWLWITIFGSSVILM